MAVLNVSLARDQHPTIHAARSTSENWTGSIEDHVSCRISTAKCCLHRHVWPFIRDAQTQQNISHGMFLTQQGGSSTQNIQSTLDGHCNLQIDAINTELRVAITYFEFEESHVGGASPNCFHQSSFSSSTRSR